MLDETRLDGPWIEPASGGPARQLVVLLHGYGADGHDLIPLAEAWGPLLPDAAFVAPHAPEPCAGVPMGRQWFPLTLRNPEEVRRGVALAEPRLNSFLDRELNHRGLTDANLALVGFSQGTMLSLYAGPHRRGRIAGILGYSGVILWSLKRAHEAEHRPPVMLVHGADDSVIPPVALPATRKALEDAGFAVEGHMRPALGHGIDAEGIRLGAGFLRRVLAVAAAEPLPAD